jgi:hypothetical protein
MQQTPSRLKIFRESCIFFALTTLLPVIGIWTFSVLYQHNNPGDGIGEGLSMLVVIPICFIASLVLGLVTLRRLPTLSKMKYVVFVPLVLAYASYHLVIRYYPHLTSLERVAAWPIGLVLLPSIIASLAATLHKWRSVGISVIAAVVGFVPLLIGSYALDTSQRYAEDNHFIQQVEALGYTLYIFPDTPKQPFINDVSLDKAETKIAIFTGLASSELTPDLDAIYERPTAANAPTETCGTGYEPTELSADETSNYACQLITSTKAGDIYQMSYTYTNFEGASTERKEYFMLTPTTVVYATYRNRSNNFPFTYDQEKSVTFLEQLVPVTGRALGHRLNMR